MARELTTSDRAILRECAKRGLSIPDAARDAERERQRAAWREDPASYYLGRLGRRYITPDQRRICESVRDHRRTAVPAGHATGKTDMCAALACWWYDAWPEHICYITAPTWDQARGLTFKQVCAFRQRGGLPGDVLQTGLVRDPNRLFAGSHYIRALNAERGEGFQGEHAAPILIVLEEAQGVPHYIWDAAEGLMTHPECRMVAIGNPTDPASDFGAACESPEWHTIEVSSLQHPNIAAELAGEPPPVPDAVRLLWVQEMIRKECVPAEPDEDHAFEFPPGSGKWLRPSGFFMGRAQGKFAPEAGDRCIPLAWARAAVGIPLVWDDGSEYVNREPVVAGWDVADGGNAEHCVYVRRGPDVLSITSWHGSVQEGTPRAIRIAEEAGASVLIYDGQGPGLEVPKAIAILPDRPAIRVVAVNSGEAASEAVQADGRKACEVFANKRAEWWYGIVRGRLRKTYECRRNPGTYKPDELLRLPDDETLIQQLAAPKVEPEDTRKILIESKLKMRARGVASPDRADALTLTFADVPPLAAPWGVRVERVTV